MGDSRLRDLERRYRETGSVEDESAWLLARIQHGTLSREELKLAALMGCHAARHALGESAPNLQPNETAAGLVFELKSHGQDALREAGMALVALVREALDEPDSVLERMGASNMLDVKAPGPVVRFARQLAQDSGLQQGLGDERICKALQEHLIRWALGAPSVFQQQGDNVVLLRPEPKAVPEEAEEQLFTTVDQVVEALNGFHPSEDDEDTVFHLYRFTDGLEGMPDARRVIPAAFSLFERCPEADYGSPGPLVSMLEAIGGYEQELVASLGRTPMPATIWMVSRILNGEPSVSERERYLRVLDSVVVRSGVHDWIRDEAREVLDYQAGTGES